MRIVIISDIHANLAALSVLPYDYDELWVLGDLVNYGPQPAEVVEFVRSRATHVVCGNHDCSIGFGEDPHCTPRFREMAEATRKFTDSVLPAEGKKYLRSLPVQAEVRVGNTHFWLCHAIPSDPLYGYCPPESERWIIECQKVPANILLVGHTHLQFVRKIGNQLVVNPGSLGQPKSGAPFACYAEWKDGVISLCSTAYPVDATIEKIRTLPIATAVQEDLINVLRTGSVPEAAIETKHAARRGA